MEAAPEPPLAPHEIAGMVREHAESFRDELSKDFKPINVDDGRAIYSLLIDLAFAVEQLATPKSKR